MGLVRAFRPVLLHIADEFRQRPEIGNRLVLDWDEQSALNSQIDADAFVILMRNLIENALEHGQSGGTVIIAVTGEGSIRVINEGNAVPPETLPQLKERFARAGRSDKGAGLGLAIADMIATGAGGGLDLISPATGSEEGFEAVFYPPKPRSTQPSSERQS